MDAVAGKIIQEMHVGLGISNQCIMKCMGAIVLNRCMSEMKIDGYNLA